MTKSVSFIVTNQYYDDLLKLIKAQNPEHHKHFTDDELVQKAVAKCLSLGLHLVEEDLLGHKVIIKKRFGFNFDDFRIDIKKLFRILNL